jgi:hypothetical protein
VEGTWDGKTVRFQFDAWNSGPSEFTGTMQSNGLLYGLSEFTANRMGSAPADPSGIAVEYGLGGQAGIGARVSWRDNSSDESCFLVQATCEADPLYVDFIDNETCDNWVANVYNVPANTPELIISSGFSLGEVCHFRVRAVRQTGDLGPNFYVGSCWSGWLTARVE